MCYHFYNLPTATYLFEPNELLAGKVVASSNPLVIDIPCQTTQGQRSVPGFFSRPPCPVLSHNCEIFH